MQQEDHGTEDGQEIFQSKFREKNVSMFEAVLASLSWGGSKHFLSHLPLTSLEIPMSDEENIELDAQDQEICEFEINDEQNENDDADMMTRRRYEDSPNIEHCEDHFEEDGENHDESAETELMGVETHPDFESMMQEVQKFCEELQIKKLTIENLIAGLNGCSNLYKIENLVNEISVTGPLVRFLVFSFFMQF